MFLLRLLFRPLGYLAFVLALATLSAAAWLLGDEHELGFFSGRLSKSIWRYPEITRRGVQMAWLVWAVLFLLALSNTFPWDEVTLAAIALVARWHHLGSRFRADG